MCICMKTSCCTPGTYTILKCHLYCNKAEAGKMGGEKGCEDFAQCRFIARVQ